MNSLDKNTSNTSWIRITLSFLGAFIIGIGASFYNRDDITEPIKTDISSPSLQKIDNIDTQKNDTYSMHSALLDNLVPYNRSLQYTLQTHTIPFLQDKYNAHSTIKGIDIDNKLYAPMIDLYRQNVISDMLFTSIIDVQYASQDMLETILSQSYNNTIKLKDNTFATYLEALMVLHNMDIDGVYRDSDDKFMYLKQVAIYRNILTKEASMYNKTDLITPYDALEMMRRVLKIKDMKYKDKGDVYYEFVHIKPSYALDKDYIAHSSLLSDSSVWLTDLTNYGFAYYYDVKRDNTIFFAHSSIWKEDTTPYGAVLEELLDPKYERIDTLETPLYFIVNSDGNDVKYVIDSYEKVDYRDIQPLLDTREDVDFIIFTCAKDLQYRLVFKGKRVDM